MKCGKSMRFIVIFSLIFLVSLFYGCAGLAASAQEYYSIGMAYFELGKFEDAEKWLNRAKLADRTMTASQYNLGRIAFETKDYEEAAKHFEGILRKDPENLLALRAAAFTRIKMNDIEKAEEVMEKYSFPLQDNNDLILLYARTQKALNKVEAIDTYARWLTGNPDKKVRYEYAQLLEKHELYARAMEEYRAVLSALESAPASSTAAGEDVKKSDVRFSLASLLLTADASSGEGITEMETAVKEGYSNIEEIETLQKNTKVSAVNRDKLRTIINDLQRAAEEKEKNETAGKNSQKDSSETNLETGSK